MKFEDPKIFLFITPFVIIVAFLANVGKKNALDFEANGIVVVASWEGKNHNMPLFIIEQNNPSRTKRKFESHEVPLTPEQIQVGHSFIKHAGSKYCLINLVEQLCVK